MQIAIDGPAGAGKSTAAKNLARELNFLYLDTGAMYRAATLAVLEAGTALDDEAAIAHEVEKHSIGFAKDGHVTLDGRDVETEIRTSRVARHTSDVAPVAKVREQLTDQMREIASGRDVIMDGRDIGSVVLPNADFKFFITASPEERARRRMGQMRRQGILGDTRFETILDEINTRDYNDSTRKTSPLIESPDAERIVTDDLEPKDVVSRMVERIRG